MATDTKTAEMITSGAPWYVPRKVLHCLCQDGKRRTVIATREADTFFSIPARVQVKGKTITGYITGRETEDGKQDYEFRAYLYRKNHTILTGA